MTGIKLSALGFAGIALTFMVSTAMMSDRSRAEDAAPVQPAAVPPVAAAPASPASPASAASSASPASGASKSSKPRHPKGKQAREKENEGTEARDRFQADTVIKSQYQLRGEQLEVDPD